MRLTQILLESEMDQIEKYLEQEFGATLRDLTAAAKSESSDLKSESASIDAGQVNESLGAIAIIGFILAMPRVIELMAKPIGKFIKLSRKFLKPKAVNDEKAVAEAIIHFAHKWHGSYIKIVKWILEVSGTFKKAGIKSDSQKNKAAELVYYIIIAALAVYSGIGSIHAFKELAAAGIETGTLSLAALESAMTSIKTQEVATFVKKLVA